MTEKRIKPFSTIDDVLLGAGNAVEYIERLRSEIYFLNKKLRKQNKKVNRYYTELKQMDSVVNRMVNRLTNGRSSS